MIELELMFGIYRIRIRAIGLFSVVFKFKYIKSLKIHYLVLH